MKKIILALAILVLASTLFAAEDAKFTLNAQVEGILFHGFTTNTYASSDAILEAQNEIQDAEIKGLKLTSNDVQPIGAYAFYSTSSVQSTVHFTTTPLKLKVYDDTYYVPYQLTYDSKLNTKIEFDNKVLGEAIQATTNGNDLDKKAPVLKTAKSSTGLRYAILDLSVEFAGDKNVSFGLPEASGANYYTGSITAHIESN